MNHIYKITEKSELLVNRMADGATCVSHVVNQDSHTVLHVSHQHHTIHLISLLPLLVNEGKVNIQPVCYRRDPASGKTL